MCSRRGVVCALASLLVAGCAVDRTGLRGPMDAGPVDAAGMDVPTPRDMPGVDAADACVDACAGGVAVTCAPASTTVCPMGCAMDGRACARFVPSNVSPTEITATPATLMIAADVDTTACVGGHVATQTTAGAGDVCVLRAAAITIPAGITVHVRGTRPLVLLASASIDVAGVLDASAVAAPGAGAVAADQPGGGGAGSEVGLDDAGGGGGGFGGRGGPGGSTPMTSAAAGGAAPSTPALVPLRGGSAGGAGGGAASVDGGGGEGGGALQVSSGGVITIGAAAKLLASGGGGRGGNAGGGGGGGSGGALLVEAPMVVVSPTALLFAVGGGGGGGWMGSPGTDGGESADFAPGGATAQPLYGAVGGRSGSLASPDGSAGASTSQPTGNGGGGGGGAGVVVLRGASTMPAGNPHATLMAPAHD